MWRARLLSVALLFGPFLPWLQALPDASVTGAWPKDTHAPLPLPSDTYEADWQVRGGAGLAAKFQADVGQTVLGAGGRGFPGGDTSFRGCATKEWPGWKGIKYAFVFGDSYTSTGFDWTRTPVPSPEHPLGNRPSWSSTSANASNWVDFLTLQHNASTLLTYDLACGGATVDSDLVAPFLPMVRSLRQQVEVEFTQGYGSQPPAAPPPAPRWTGANALFAVWIGINDVARTYASGPDVTAPLNARVLAAYAALAETLYGAGARNFLLVNVPPVDRAPLTTGGRHGGPGREEAAALERADIESFNAGVARLAAGLKRNHTDEVNVWVFDANGVFGDVLDDPGRFPETAGYRNTTDYCGAYENGTPDVDTLYPACHIPVNQYFWLNSLHPTYPVHNVTARLIAQTLALGPTVGCA